IQKAFEEHFGGSAKVKEPVYQVIVDFLPVTLRDSLADSTSRIAEENGLPEGTIERARWIRAPKNWNAGQRFAHAIMTIRGRTEASKIIQRGIIVEGQRMRARKLEEEPRRCFKCQQFGHMAAKCKVDHEVCPNCAGKHQSGQCDKTRVDFQCANCTKVKLKADHAAWDRACPRYAEEKRKVKGRDPGSQYMYFPAEEEWTW
ncbi:hypothetical protein BYT27DRAFT_7008846, partial [Phlegmacium glaucopus]